MLSCPQRPGRACICGGRARALGRLRTVTAGQRWRRARVGCAAVVRLQAEAETRVAAGEPVLLLPQIEAFSHAYGLELLELCVAAVYACMLYAFVFKEA